MALAATRRWMGLEAVLAGVRTPALLAAGAGAVCKAMMALQSWCGMKNTHH